MAARDVLDKRIDEWVIAQSSDQSNWNASPAMNARGTNTPRPAVFCSRSRAAFQSRAKAATRLYDPS
jgi:hypothetical protein